MLYPSHLLPQVNFKLIDNDIGNLCLLRHSHLPQDKLLDKDTGRLKNEVIAMGAEKILPDYSVSLFGIFRAEDIQIKVINDDYLKYCNPDTDVNTPIYEQDFCLISNRGYWSVLVSKIHNAIVSYDDNSLEAKCIVRHTPMRWNFWHFSINWYLYSINDFWHNHKDALPRTIKRKLASEARGLLKEFSRPLILSDVVLEDKYYVKD